MSPKATSVKNKKESKDSKRPDLPIATGSAPAPRTDVPSISGEGTTRKGSVYKIDTSIKESKKDTYFPSEFDMESVDDVKETLIDDNEVEDDEFIEEAIKFSEYFHPLTRMMIKVFTKGKQVTAIPTLLHNIVDRKKEKFIRLGMMNRMISRTIDKELDRIDMMKPESDEVLKRLCTSEDYNYGDDIDIRIDSFDKDTSDEFFLTSENYEELFVMAYEATKTVVLHVHIDKLYIKSRKVKDELEDKEGINFKEESFPTMKIKTETKRDDDAKSETPITFRGIPIDMDGMKQDQCKPHSNDRLLDDFDAAGQFGNKNRDRRHCRNQCSPRPSMVFCPR